MNLIKSVEPAELAALEAQWGQTPSEHHRLDVEQPFLTGRHQQLVSDGRRAEICYVMHQGDPAQGVLLHRKTYYPTGTFRLPTGGIHHGESVWATLGREITEETGLAVGATADHAQVQRFLGLVSYELVHRSLQQTYSFATYCFLVQMPAGASLDPQDPAESIAAWGWQPASELSQVADTLEAIGEQFPTWGDWGQFRAVSHRFLATLLTGTALHH
jgi:ADP-ribose pyrophosphatase YjhB (NUDIX family)